MCDICKPREREREGDQDLANVLGNVGNFKQRKSPINSRRVFLILGRSDWIASLAGQYFYQVMIVACDYVDKTMIFFHVIMYFLFMRRRMSRSRRGAFLLNAQICLGEEEKREGRGGKGGFRRTTTTITTSQSYLNTNKQTSITPIFISRVGG